MNSIILCEGIDDLWFVGYYLNKVAGWDDYSNHEKFWKLYQPHPLSRKQHIQFFSKNDDCVAIWSVSGKDSFSSAISQIRGFANDYPDNPPDSIVIIRDRDRDSEEDILSSIEAAFDHRVSLSNKTTTAYLEVPEVSDANMLVTPIIIPFNGEGAIETLLIESIRAQGTEEAVVVNEANKYIDSLLSSEVVKARYFKHERLILKSRFSAVIAATNPTHSTGSFQDVVLSCPWESSAHIKEYFGTIIGAITSPIT